MFVDTNKGLHLVITGAPGTGKGTHAGVIQREFDICHLSAGEMLRDEIRRRTPLGKKLEPLLAGGNFAPDDLVIEMVSKRIEEKDCKNGFILDGFPRTLNQAKFLDNMLKQKGIKLDAVLEILVPDKVIIDRILGRYTCVTCGESYSDEFHRPKVKGVCDICGGRKFSKRLDDTKETIERRLVKYRDFTYPTIDYYKKKGILRDVNGNGDVAVVSKRIDKVLGFK